MQPDNPSSIENPYAAPVDGGGIDDDEAPATGIAAEWTAGFGRRAGARLLDWVVTQLLALAGGVGAFIVCAVAWPEKVDLLGERAENMSTSVSLLVGVCVTLVYHVLCEWLGGASAGKLLTGLRVLNADGGRCGLRGALVRNLGYFVDMFFFGLVGYSAMSASPTRQRVGDQMARTVVVRRALLPPVESSGGHAFVGVVAGAAAGTGAAGALLLLLSL